MATEYEKTKVFVKRTFKMMKKADPDLKLMHVYNNISRLRGFKDWNTYAAHLKAIEGRAESEEGRG